MATSTGRLLSVAYLPTLDVARGVAAGFQVVADVLTDADPRSEAATAAAVLRRALDDVPTLPKNTFLAIPLDVDILASDEVRRVLTSYAESRNRADRTVGGLAGIVIDVVRFESARPPGRLEDAITEYRAAGALIAVGGHGMPQPELSSIVRLKPSIIRLGREWTRGIDRSESKRSAIEITGQLAGQLDAWVLAEGVATSGELRALAGLGVPLAEGPFIGDARPHWPEIEQSARTTLPLAAPTSDGVLRALIQPAYTTTDAAAAIAVLPETTGFDVLVVLDRHQRPQALLRRDESGAWAMSDVLCVNIDTPVGDAVTRAMNRTRASRFVALACTDNAGRLVGVLPIEQLMSHLALAGT